MWAKWMKKKMDGRGGTQLTIHLYEKPKGNGGPIPFRIISGGWWTERRVEKPSTFFSHQHIGTSKEAIRFAERNFPVLNIHLFAMKMPIYTLAGEHKVRPNLIFYFINYIVILDIIPVLFGGNREQHRLRNDITSRKGKQSYLCRIRTSCLLRQGWWYISKEIQPEWANPAHLFATRTRPGRFQEDVSRNRFCSRINLNREMPRSFAALV